MKRHFVSGLLGLLVLSAGLNAQATITSPRDLTCDLGSGSRVILKSNNSLWAVWAIQKFNVDLILENDNGFFEKLPVTWVNNKAAQTRGNAQGERQYIFTSQAGETFFVTLEFYAPFGVAEGIKLFRVKSNSLQFEHEQSSLNGKCNVVYYPLINL